MWFTGEVTTALVFVPSRERQPMSGYDLSHNTFPHSNDAPPELPRRGVLIQTNRSTRLKSAYRMELTECSCQYFGGEIVNLLRRTARYLRAKRRCVREFPESDGRFIGRFVWEVVHR